MVSFQGSCLLYSFGLWLPDGKWGIVNENGTLVNVILVLGNDLDGLLSKWSEGIVAAFALDNFTEWDHDRVIRVEPLTVH